jgi:hypothetical protein
MDFVCGAVIPFGWVLVVFEHRLHKLINRGLRKPFGKFVFVVSELFSCPAATFGFSSHGKCGRWQLRRNSSLKCGDSPRKEPITLMNGSGPRTGMAAISRAQVLELFLEDLASAVDPGFHGLGAAS